MIRGLAAVSLLARSLCRSSPGNAASRRDLELSNICVNIPPAASRFTPGRTPQGTTCQPVERHLHGRSLHHHTHEHVTEDQGLQHMIWTRGGGQKNNQGAMTTKTSLLKVILLGDGGVGKSSLMNRYVTNKFDAHLFHTIGVEFLNRDLEVDGHQVTLQIWDTAGQERFRSLRTPFYRGSDCCLLTFSVDDNQSFLNLGNWKKEFIYYADVKEPEKFPFVILGNKVDVTERQVSTEEAQQWCQENGNYPYYETSAKDATNVAVAFEEAVRRVLAMEERTDHLIPTDTVKLHRKPRSAASCCS